MDRDRLAQMIGDGWSLERIGAELGRHPSTVSYWLRKHGLPAAHADRHSPRGSIPREELTDLVARDLTVREIADATGRSPTTVRYWLRRYDLRTTDRARFVRRRARVRMWGHCARHGRTTFIGERGGRAVCARCRAEGVSAWRRRAKQILVEEAGGRCRLCGYERCIGALHFHHVDPRTKRFGLGSRGLARSLAALREEASKCVLLCSNCHVEVEMGLAKLALPSPRADLSGVAHDPG
jgi:DNA-binding CsgD family transcriptional regulator